MKYRPGQKVMYKNYESQVVFCHENYKAGRNAYVVKLSGVEWKYTAYAMRMS